MASRKSSDSIEFDWTEVDCFLRPQFVLCGEIAPAYGLLLVFLTSLYRTWGIDGFFVSPDKQHFSFLRMVFQKLTGIEFTPTYIEDKIKILDVLENKLRTGGAAIVPTNVKQLDYFRDYNQRDQAHYFIVTAFNRELRSFAVKDSLYPQAVQGNTEHRSFEMPLEIFEKIIGLYWDTHVAAPRLQPHREASYWILQIQANERAPQREEEEVLLLIESEYTRLVTELGDGRTPSMSLEDRHFPDLILSHKERDIGRLDPLIRAYLMDVNLSLVHLKILFHVHGRLGWPVEDSLIAEVERYRKESGTLRSKLFTKCMTTNSVSREEWEAARTTLVSMAHSLRKTVALAGILGSRFDPREGCTRRGANA